MTKWGRLAVAGWASLVVLCTCATEAHADYRSTVLGDGPFAYYRLDETGNATTMVNEIDAPAGTDGTHILSPVQGLPGALAFETPNRAIAYTDQDADRSQFWSGGSYTAFSIEFWMFTVMANSASTSTSWFNGPGLVDGEVNGITTDAGVSLIRDGHVGFGMGSPDTTIEGSTDVSDGEWHHVVATADGAGTMNLYVDGGLEATTTTGPTGPRTNQNFTIGSLDTTHWWFNGGIDEVAFYRRMLTDAEVFEHYQVGTTRQIRVFVSEIAHAGDGRVTNATWGINCHLPNRPGDVCGADVPVGTPVTFRSKPDRGSRSAGWSASSECETSTSTTCTITADGTGNSDFDYVIPDFHLTGTSIGTGLSRSVDRAAETLEAAQDHIVDPRNEDAIKPLATKLLRPALNFGDRGGAQVISLPASQVKPGGSFASTLTPSAPSPSRLIGPDGATLIGPDGATLIGPDGATLIGPDGATRRAGTGSCAETSESGRIVVLGRYVDEVKPTESLTSSPVTFKYTPEGKRFIETFAKMNLRLSAPKTLFATYVEAVQPSDELGTGASYSVMCVKN